MATIGDTLPADRKRWADLDDGENGVQMADVQAGNRAQLEPNQEPPEEQNQQSAEATKRREPSPQRTKSATGVQAA